MALRSCLCSTTKRYAPCIQHLNSSSLLVRPFLFRATHTASVSKPTPICLTTPERLPIVSGLERELEAILRQSSKKHYPKAFYNRLSHCTPQQIVHLFDGMMAHHPYDHLSPVMVEAARHWNLERLLAVMRQCGERFQQWRYDLFCSVLLARYTRTHDLAPILEALPLKGKSTDVMPFYNAILVKSQKLKRHDHVHQVIRIMKERQWTPDTATYNILIREQLSTLSGSKATIWFDQLIEQGMVPNRATYHIFIRHAIGQEDWQGLPVWLTRMEQAAFQPNAILVRILLKALVEQPQEPALVAAFERIVGQKMIDNDDDGEKLLNTAAAALLDSNHLETAIELLHMAISRKSNSIYTYNLLLRGLCHQGNTKRALQLWRRMDQDDSIPPPDIVTYTTLIHGLVRHHHSLEQIVELYQHMLRQGISTNNVLQSTLLQAMMKSAQNPKAVFNMFQLVLSHQHHLNESLDLIQVYNMMIDYYFLHYHKSHRDRFPQETLQFLMEAVDQKKLKPTVATLNIMVRGLAILNKDVRSAEETVELFKTRGVDVNERTVFYLTKAACRQGDRDKARQWISTFEEHHVIRGKGLLYLKQQLMPS